jgi:hypothetical protein
LPHCPSTLTISCYPKVTLQDLQDRIPIIPARGVDGHAPGFGDDAELLFGRGVNMEDQDGQDGDGWLVAMYGVSGVPEGKNIEKYEHVG